MGDIYSEMPSSADGRFETFETYFRDHYPAVLAFAIRRLPDRGSAEDAAAETFAVAWRRRDLIPEQPLPWLFAIAIRVIANQRRSGKRRRRLGDRLEQESSYLPDPEPVDLLHRRDSFAAAFERLSEGDREVLRLIAWDGLASEEAASVLGCSGTAFRVRLHRARRRLAKHLEAAGHSPYEHPNRASKPTEEPS